MALLHVKTFLVDGYTADLYFQEGNGFTAKIKKDEIEDISLIVPFKKGFTPTEKQLRHIRSSFSQYSKKVSEETHCLILGLQLKGGGCLLSKPKRSKFKEGDSPDTRLASASAPKAKEINYDSLGDDTLGGGIASDEKHPTKRNVSTVVLTTPRPQSIVG